MGSSNKNLVYKSENIASRYSHSRTTWETFFPSEKRVIERLNPQATTTVIDMGCACGGLGLALSERFGIKDYTGIDINQSCIETAREICTFGKFHCGDFLSLEKEIDRTFELGFSLSCADWNVQTEQLLAALFNKISPGGNLVFSCRLTNKTCSSGLFEAKQAIVAEHATDTSDMEYAPYKVYRLERILDMLAKLPQVSSLYGFGYWGKVPDSVKELPFEDIFYCVFSIKKQDGSSLGQPFSLQLEVPPDIFHASR